MVRIRALPPVRRARTPTDILSSPPLPSPLLPCSLPPPPIVALPCRHSSGARLTCVASRLPYGSVWDSAADRISAATCKKVIGKSAPSQFHALDQKPKAMTLMPSSKSTESRHSIFTVTRFVGIFRYDIEADTAKSAVNATVLITETDMIDQVRSNLIWQDRSPSFLPPWHFSCCCSHAVDTIF